MFLHLDRVGPPQSPCAHLNDGCSAGKGSDAEIVFALSILQSWVRGGGNPQGLVLCGAQQTLWALLFCYLGTEDYAKDSAQKDPCEIL